MSAEEFTCSLCRAVFRSTGGLRKHSIKVHMTKLTSDGSILLSAEEYQLEMSKIREGQKKKHKLSERAGTSKKGRIDGEVSGNSNQQESDKNNIADAVLLGVSSVAEGSVNDSLSMSTPLNVSFSESLHVGLGGAYIGLSDISTDDVVVPPMLAVVDNQPDKGSDATISSASQVVVSSAAGSVAMNVDNSMMDNSAAASTVHPRSASVPLTGVQLSVSPLVPQSSTDGLQQVSTHSNALGSALLDQPWLYSTPTSTASVSTPFFMIPVSSTGTVAEQVPDWPSSVPVGTLLEYLYGRLGEDPAETVNFVEGGGRQLTAGQRQLLLRAVGLIQQAFQYFARRLVLRLAVARVEAAPADDILRDVERWLAANLGRPTPRPFDADDLSE